MAYIPQNSPSSQSPATQLKSLQVIVVALMGGMLAFTGLATYMALTRGAAMVPQQGATPPPGGAVSRSDPTMMLYVVSGAVSAMSIVAFIVVGRLAVADVRKKAAGLSGDARERTAVQGMMVSTIIRAAFAEGAGLLGAVVVLLTGTLYTLGAVVVATVLLMMLMPVRSRMESMLAEVDRLR